MPSPKRPTDGLETRLDKQLKKLGDIDNKLAKLTDVDNELGKHTNHLEGMDGKLTSLEGATATRHRLGLNSRGDEVRKLHEDLGHLGLQVPEAEVEGQLFGVGTRDALRLLQSRHGHPRTGELDDLLRGVIASEVGGGQGARRLEGRVLLEHGSPASGTALKLYTTELDGSEKLVSEAPVDAQGYYSLEVGKYDATKDLIVKAANLAGDELSLSEPFVFEGTHREMNLVGPSSLHAADGEFARLSVDLKAVLGDDANLANLREDTDRHDIGRLHRTTGWDGRVIATAALAAQLSSTVKVPMEAAYGMLRLGLPTNPDALAGTPANVIGEALEKAVASGIVELDPSQIKESVGALENYAFESFMSHTAPGSISSLQEMLRQSELTESERLQFASVIMGYDGSGSGLWQEAINSGIDSNRLDSVRLQGKLAHLTSNSAAMTKSLMSEISGADRLSDLVDKDFHKPQTWRNRLNAIAGGEEAKLEKLIPTNIVGKDIKERFEKYSRDMACKVSLAFPTRVVSRKIQQGEIELGTEHNEIRDNVRNFLNKSEDLGFELGRFSIDSFAETHRDVLFPGEDIGQIRKKCEPVRTLQRLYQITPTDEALNTVYKLGFKSAHCVVAHSYDEYMKRYSDVFDSKMDAELLYRRAEQVTTVTYGFLASVAGTDASPSLLAVSGSDDQRAAFRSRVAGRYPAMEDLFGSLDFCECRHCRSVLSPAAYFVDLLQLVNPDTAVWNSFTSYWVRTHNGEDYTTKYKKAYDVLCKRRPDLAHLPLTCENTHTVLPHIDLVNEILEFFVAHNELTTQAAHDTGDAQTADLLAEPQNILPQAYKCVLEAKYPLTLPFDLWLESARQFLGHFETPFWKILDLFRPTDQLYSPAGGGAAGVDYYRFSVFVEQLGISPTEYAIFTSPSPLDDWHKLYGYEGTTPSGAQDQQYALDSLKSAKTLSRRLEVTYKELVEIVKTRFINPDLDNLEVLRKLDISVSEVFSYKNDILSPEERQAFEDRLAALTAQYQDHNFDAAAWLTSTYDSGGFSHVLVLRDPNAGCNFDETTLVFANGDEIDAFVLLKLNYLVRLWKRLKFSMADTDLALSSLIPKDVRENLTKDNIGDGFKSALIYLAHLEALRSDLKVDKEERARLLTLWAPISTMGADSLYADLFLNPSVLEYDAAFDHPLGEFMQSPNQFVRDHMLALQSALGLTADEITRILDSKSMDAQTTVLSLENVSMLFRHRVLVDALGLNIQELLTLVALSGVDPFSALEDGPLIEIGRDFPFVKTIRFVRLAQAVKESGLTVSKINYLVRHEFDPVGELRNDVIAAPELVQTLSSELRRIDQEYAMPVDSTAVNDEWFREKLSLVLDQETVDRFLGFWSDSIEFSATDKNVAPENSLDPDTYQKDQLRVEYNATQTAQTVIYRGVLTQEKKTLMLNEHAGAPQFFKDLIDQIADDSRGLPDSFYREQFGSLVSYDDVFGAAASGLSDDDRRQTIAEAFSRFVATKLKRAAILETLVASFGSDHETIEALLGDTDLLTSPTGDGPPSSPTNLFDSLMILGSSGCTIEKYGSADLTGAMMAPAEPNSDLVWPGTANVDSVRVRGFIEVPVGGDYRFTLMPKKVGARGRLRFVSIPDWEVVHTTTAAETEGAGYLELKPGTPYEYELEGHNLQADAIKVEVMSDTLPRGPVDRVRMYPTADRSIILLAKTLQLIQALELSVREIRYLWPAVSGPTEPGIDRLPTRRDELNLAKVQVLFGKLMRLVRFASLRDELSEGTDDLIDIFQCSSTAAGTNDPAQVAGELFVTLCQKLSVLARREPGVIQAAARRLGFDQLPPAAERVEGVVSLPAFADGELLGRLWECLKLLEQLGMSVDSVVASTRLISGGLNNKQRFEVSREFRQAVKARYSVETWRKIAQPVFDKLRQKQRDALVALIMHREHMERTEELYEFFLIDPGMEPVVQTSRLKQATASVQLFIQRCFLSLEEEVHPSSISSDNWRWMKRYRVWEANRKIFLFPENWLEPEFRDDKTHLYQELESTLLESDLTNDLAEDAFFQYLKKLEELARLDMVAMYCEEKPLDPGGNTVHVIGRTFSQPHKYFYRSYAYGMWTPWEPVGADVEGQHLSLIRWRGRLHLFWLTFIDGADDKSSAQSEPKEERPATGIPLTDLKNNILQAAKFKMMEIQLHWCERYQGEWTSRESSEIGEPMRFRVMRGVQPKNLAAHATMVYEDGEEREVRIDVYNNTLQVYMADVACRYKSFSLASKNAPPEISGGDIGEPITDWDVELHTVYGQANANRLAPYGPLITFFRKTWLGTSEDLQVQQKLEFPIDYQVQRVLKRGSKSAQVLHRHPSNPPMSSSAREDAFPFFYSDDRHTFFVDPTIKIETIQEWEWFYTPPKPKEEEEKPKWPDIPPEFPHELPPGFPQEGPGWGDPPPIDPYAKYKLEPKRGWVTDPEILIDYKGQPIGYEGKTDPAILDMMSEGLASGKVTVIGADGVSSRLADDLSNRRGLNGAGRNAGRWMPG